MSDLISREGTIKSIENMKRFQQDTDDICEMIQNLPSVTPQPEKRTEERTETHVCDCVDRSTLLSKATVLSDIDSNMNIVNHEVVYVKDIKELPSVKLQKDCISREAAVEILDDYAEDIESGNWGTAYSKARTSMCELPSVEPERKTGHWTNHGDCWECGVCHEVISEEHFPTTKYLAPIYNFCPICGADMKGV